MAQHQKEGRVVVDVVVVVVVTIMMMMSLFVVLDDPQGLLCKYFGRIFTKPEWVKDNTG